MKKIFLVFSLLLFAVGLKAQKADLDYYLPAGISYNTAIPTPESVLGYQVGEWHVRHDQQVNYMHAVAAASDRVTITEYGRTYEQRPLLQLTITSPENHANIDEIKRRHLMLSDAGSSAGLDVSEMPVVVSLNYSVHGNESSGANASLLVVYHLAAAQGREIDELLANTVILVDPNMNPDGSSRFSQWVNTHKSTNVLVTDPNSREFGEAWPGGRTNHYWFDLNRDWLLVQHPEGRGRSLKFQEWKPNIVTDHHEMGSSSTFFFQPGIPTQTNPLTPQKNQDLTAEIGNYHAEELNKIQSLYYTKESFDDFYYGKGSTYPDVQGSVGILFEQASSRGHEQENAFGSISFPFTIRNHFTVSLSTLRASQGMRDVLLNYMREFYQDMAKEAKASAIKAYVFGEDTDQAKTFHMADILKQHNIEVYELKEDFSKGGASFSKGKAYVVPAEQQQFQLIKSVFERRTEFTDSLFYDISAWTFPYSFNMPFAELSSREFSDNLTGQLFDGNMKKTGRVVGGRSDYAYIFEWNEYYTPRTLYRLLSNGVQAQVAQLPFSIATDNGPRQFGYGSVIVPLGVQENQQKVHDLIQQAADEDNITVYAVSTGLSGSGIDLGSNNMAHLQTPKVMMIGGVGTNSSEVGEVWHLFDQRYHMPLSIVEQNRVNARMLDRYNVILMSGFSYAGLSADAVEGLKRWVRNGGTLIAYKQAVNWVRQQGLADIEFVNAGETDDNTPREYVKQRSDSGSQVIGGAIFNVNLDLSHPLAYGYQRKQMQVLRNSTIFLKPGKNPYSSPVLYTEKPLASGYISDRNQELLAGTAGAVVNRYGAGKVIAFTDNHNFRAFWFGTNKLFMNAVFFGHTINAATAN